MLKMLTVIPAIILLFSSYSAFTRETHAIIIRADAVDVRGTETVYNSLVAQGAKEKNIYILDNLEHYPKKFQSDGVSARTVRTSSNKGYTALAKPFSSLEEIKKTLKNVGQNVAPNDHLVLVIQSHGARVLADVKNSLGSPALKETSAVIMEAASNQEIVEVSLTPKELKKMIHEFLPKNISLLVVVSSCYSGGFSEVLDPERSMTIITTADDQSFSWGSRMLVEFFNSFTINFLGTLPADLNQDGVVDYAEAFKASRKKEAHYEYINSVGSSIKSIYLNKDEVDTNSNSKFISNYGGLETIEYHPELHTNMLLGDLDGNGEINDLDKEIMLNFHRNLTRLSTYQLRASDINQDSRVDLTDLGEITSLKKSFVRIPTHDSLSLIVVPKWQETHGTLIKYIEFLITNAEAKPGLIPAVETIINNAKENFGYEIKSDSEVFKRWKKLNNASKQKY